MTCQHNICDCVDVDATGFCSEHCRRATTMPDMGDMEGVAPVGGGGRRATTMPDMGDMEGGAPIGGGGRDCGCGHPECTGGTVPLT